MEFMIKMLEEITLLLDKTHHAQGALKPDRAVEIFARLESSSSPDCAFSRLHVLSHCNDQPQCPTKALLKRRTT